MAPLAPSKLSATGFTYLTTPTGVCVWGVWVVWTWHTAKKTCVCVCEWVSVGVRQKAQPQTDRQKHWGGPTVSDELCVFCVMACGQRMGELEISHSHNHLLIKLTWSGPTRVRQQKHVFFRCELFLTRASANRYRYQHMWAQKTFYVEALSSASYTSIITFSVRSIPEHLAAPKSAKTSGLIYFHGGK